jgi:hypothetical protein
MITHIVLLQIKPDIAPERITQALHRIQQLEASVPGLLHVQANKNLSTLHKGYEYGYIMQFASQEALQAFPSHPSYGPVKAELQLICQSNIVFDVAQPATPWNELLSALKRGYQSLLHIVQGGKAESHP